MVLDRYLASRFLMLFLMVLGIMFLLLTLIDFAEEVRFFDELPLADVMEIVLLNAPSNTYEILPLVMILASVALFLRLARTSELVVIRAAGRSALRALIAPALTAFMVGLVTIGVFNPLVAATSKRHNDLVNRYSTGSDVPTLAIAVEGLWMRQGDRDSQSVIHATRASSDLTVLYNMTIISFSPSGEPLERVFARTARLSDGEWEMEDVKRWDLTADNPEASAQKMPTLTMVSHLTQERILETFGAPEYISLWDMPAFIDRLEVAGFSARRYEMWFNRELARPIFLMSLLMIAAAFTMRHTRLGNTGVSVLVAIMLGFALHYIRNFASILGEAGQLPIALAAWTPPLAALSLALGILLHKEDG